MKDTNPFRKNRLSEITRLRDGRFVVAGSNGTIGISDDDGFHWRRGRLDPKHAWTDILRIRQLASGGVYALGVSELFVSDDGGESWRALPRSYDLAVCSPFHQAACEMAVGTDAQSLLVTSCNYNNYSDAASSGLYRTVDGGATWTCIAFDGDAAFAGVAELPDGTILVANRGSLQRFDRAGARQSSDSYSYDANDIVVDEGRVWIAAFPGVVLSTDCGASWSTVLENERSIERLAVVGETICALDGRSAFVSHDGGKHWDSHETKPGLRAVALTPTAAVAVGNDGLVERIAWE